MSIFDLFAAKRNTVLRFFRLNDPYRLLGVLFLMVLLALPLLIGSIPLTVREFKSMLLGESLNEGWTMYVQVIDDTPWLMAQCAKWIVWLFGRSTTARQLVALLILFFQASFFSVILVRNKAYNESNYFPALIFAIICFFSFDMLSLSGELFASTFLLLAMNNLFKEIEFKVQRDESIVSLGVFIGLASLFVLSYSIFLVGTLILLLTLARLNLRRSLLLLFGFAFPHSLILSFYYFNNGLGEVGRLFYISNLSFHAINFISWSSMLWLSSALLVYFLLSMFMLSREARFTRYQTQLLQVMLLWLLLAVIEVFLSREFTPHSFVTFIPSIAYFISHYLLLIRRKWIAELMLWLFLLSVLGVSTAARLSKLERVDYSTMFLGESRLKLPLQNKRLLVLSNELPIYRTNKKASYFLNWELSKEIFELKDYNKDLILISESFRQDLPDVIVDEKNMMKEIFSRLPSLQREYVRNGVLYERKK